VQLEEEVATVKEHFDPSVPKGRGEGLGLPEFLKKRAAMPPVLDPMGDAFATRMAAGSIKKADPHAPRPVEHAFNLTKVGKGLDDHESAASRVEAPRPPKAVYVKKSRKELYDHKLELKPFNWFDQQKAQATLNTFNEHNK
jgi:hypothetical protein